MSELSSPRSAGLFSTKVSGPLRETLDDLVAGENSIARKLQTSRKYQMVFNRAQKQHRKEVGRPEVGGPDQEEISASVFAKDICNFSFNDARFDSRCRPLLRIFALLPVAIETLSLLSGSEGDVQDRVWASAPPSKSRTADRQPWSSWVGLNSKLGVPCCRQALLNKWGGEAGYYGLVGAAVAADAMMAGWTFIKLCDSEMSDVAVNGRQACEILRNIRALLDDGGVFRESAKGTLTHACLAAIKGRLVLVGQGTSKESAVMMGWPAPEEVGRHRPVAMAKECAPQSRSAVCTPGAGQDLPLHCALVAEVLQSVRAVLPSRLSHA